MLIKADNTDPTSTTSLLASPGSEGSWLTGRGTNNLKNSDKQRAAQQLHIQYQENLARQGTDDSHRGSVRSSQELDEGNVITNDDYFRRLAMVQLPAPPPIPDDDPAYSPPSGRIPSSIVVGRAGDRSRSGGRGGSGSSQASSSGDDNSRSRSREGHSDGIVGAEEDEGTVRTLAKDASKAAAATSTITTTTVTASASLKKGLSPLPQVKGLDVGVNAGVGIPPDAESDTFTRVDNAVDGGDNNNARNAYATEYDYDYYDEGTFVQEMEARRPVTLTHRRDAEKIHSREVFLDRVWDGDGSRRASAVGGVYGGTYTASRRGSALAGGVAAAAARLVSTTDQPALDVAVNDSKNSSKFGYDDKNGDDNSSPTYAVVRNARSVDLRNSAEYKHAKHLSAGSAKLLDIGSNSGGNGSKRQSADSTLAAPANVTSVAVTTSKADVANAPEATVTTTTTTGIATATASTTADLSNAEMASNITAATAATTTASPFKTAAEHPPAIVLQEQMGEQDNPPRGRTLLSPASIGSTSHPSSELRSSSGGDSYRFL